MAGTVSFTAVFPEPWDTRSAPRPGRCPLTLARVLAGRPGGRGGPRPGAPERNGAGPARLLRIAGSSRPLPRAAGALCPPLPALTRALPRTRPDPHVAAPNPRLARPLAHTEDCGRAPDPRAGRGQPGGDQRLSRPGTGLPGGARAVRWGRWEGPSRRETGRREVPRPGARGARVSPTDEYEHVQMGDAAERGG